MTSSPASDSELDSQEFLSFVAHELKTPLTIIKGYSATLRRMLDGEEERQMAADIEEQTDRVTRVVNQLLDVSRIESGRITLRPARLELLELVEDVVSRHRARDPARPIRVDAENDHLVCLADETTLRHILDDLLLNARQYSAEGKEIFVSAQRRNGDMEIALRDLGRGIAPSDLPRLTEKRYRGLGAEGEGLGLGLYIASALLAMQGGQLVIESELGRGSTFRVILPAA
jgi:signal transduction histidine kinase